jgi:hypothetical protein
MSKTAIEKRNLLGVAIGAALLSAAPISLHWSPATGPSLSLDRADARIGRPLSPGSIAGVQRRVYRRTARRAYYGGAAAVGAAAVGAAAAGAAGAYYDTAASNDYDSGYSPYNNSGYNNLYSYSPPASAAAATSTASAPASDSPDIYAEFPALYAACLDRTFGSCPRQ